MKGRKQLKALAKLPSAAFAVLIFAMGAVTANGAVPTPRPRPTPAPRPTPPLRADIGSSYSSYKVPYSMDGEAIMEAIGHPMTVDPVGAYGDFNRDGIPDMVITPLSG